MHRRRPTSNARTEAARVTPHGRVRLPGPEPLDERHSVWLPLDASSLHLSASAHEDACRAS